MASLKEGAMELARLRKGKVLTALMENGMVIVSVDDGWSWSLKGQLKGKRQREQFVVMCVKQGFGIVPAMLSLRKRGINA